MDKQNQKGSSLIEVVVAMLILALLVTGLNACVVSLVKSNLSSKELATATSNAYKLFEDLRRDTYAQVQSHSDIVSNKYLRTWRVTEDSTQKKIDVEIAWPLSTQKHKIELSTIIARQ
jgi:prepilin-type N-terminal cleavage/methylation domain-containing protein